MKKIMLLFGMLLMVFTVSCKKNEVPVPPPPVPIETPPPASVPTPTTTPPPAPELPPKETVLR